MAAVRAVLFDLFDTLVDLALEDLTPVHVGGELVSPTAPELHRILASRHEVPFDAFVGALRRVDRRYRESRYREGIELPTRERFEAVLGELGLEDAELPELMTSAHMGQLRGQVRAVPHHVDVLRELRARGLRLGLCSNFTHAATAEGILEELGLAPLLDSVAISETVGFRKPRREIFDAALAGLDASPQEVLHVGDNLDADVGGAHALGIRTAWLTRRVPDPARARARSHAPPPDHTLPDLSALPSLWGRSYFVK